MSLNPRCYALSQITYLVNTINKKNYKSSCAEISSVRCSIYILFNAHQTFKQLVEKHSPVGDFHLFRCLMSYVELSDNKINKEGQQVNN